MLAGAAAAALAALGVFVSTSAGSTASSSSTHQSGSALVKQSAAFRSVTVRPRASTASSQFVYRASKAITLLSGHFATGKINCPSSHPVPVAGQFNSNSALVFASASFAHNGGWITRLSNAGSSTASVQIGAVCGL
jgi:hypothetical protein